MSDKKEFFQLRLLGTTDLHVSLTGYDYYQDQETEKMGLSRTASLIHQARAEADNCLLLDNGDILQGNPIGDYAATTRYWQQTTGVHPLIELMNLLQYDAATVGNHEFNYGLEYLEACIAGAKFPYTNANVHRLENNQQTDHLLQPYLLLQRSLTARDGKTADICVGIIGVVPPQIMSWDKSQLEGRIDATDMVETVKYTVPQMRQAGADIIVLLAHCGYVEADSPAVQENAVIPLSQIDGIDAIFFGHAHKCFPGEEFTGRPGVDLDRGTIYGIPAAEPGVWGSHLGVIDLQLEYSEQGWNVIQGQSQVRPVYDTVAVQPLVEADALLEQTAQDAHQRTIHDIRKPVGNLLQPVYSYFSLVMDTSVVQLINDAQLNCAEQLLKETPYAKLPLLSAASPFKTGGRYGPAHYTFIAPGELTLRHVSDIYSYANTLCIVRLNGSEVREWLEWSAGLYATIQPGSEDQELIDPTFSTFNFDIIDGLNYQIDVSQLPRYTPEGELLHPESRRITKLSYKDQPVTEAIEFAVVTNQYRAFSTPLANPDGQRVIIDAEVENREVVADYIRQQSHMKGTADGNWSLICGNGIERSTVRFQSSPDAKTYVSDYAELSFIKLEDNGFASYRMQL